MDDKLSLLDFDIIGLIKLKDVHGIEKYVTPVGNEIIPGKTEYLSRSKEYYNVKSMSELFWNREELKGQLTREFTKRNFVILENMLNCSAKAYFKKFEAYIESGKDITRKMEMLQARQCLLEDTSNIIKILQGKGLISVNQGLTLPQGYENSARRYIEMDNKSAIFEFAKTLETLNINPEEYEVVTPGYGSIYIGPFLQAMYGYKFTNLLKSKYITETSQKKMQTSGIRALVAKEDFIDEGKKVLLLDDNIGTGETMKDIRKMLATVGIDDSISGAIQYNWRNYYRVFAGEKKDIEKFDVGQFDIVSPLNYAGHKLYEHAINELHNSGESYIQYLKSKSYRKEEISDIEGSVLRSIVAAKKTGLDLSDHYKGFITSEGEQETQINEDEQKTIKPTAQIFIDTLIDDVQQQVEMAKKEREGKNLSDN